MTAERTTVVDCRWLGYSGVGRVTELLLTGLSSIAPGGTWILWGDEGVLETSWAGAEHLVTTHSPLALLGQRDAVALPTADRYLFPHLVRPLRRSRRALVIAHDTIPVRWGGGRAYRASRRAFYTLSARTARKVLVYSSATAGRVVQDLGLPQERLARVSLPIDLGLARSVRTERARTQPEDVLLYVGINRAQKNLERAILGYSKSHFAAAGGRFRLVGLQPKAVEELSQFARRNGIAGVEPRPRCSDAELAGEYIEARAVIQPSLEEGLGLTVIEAIAAGVATCCSAIPALEEAARGFATLFDPYSPTSIARGIDDAIASSSRSDLGGRAQQYEDVARIPSPTDFARQVLAVLACH